MYIVRKGLERLTKEGCQASLIDETSASGRDKVTQAPRNVGAMGRLPRKKGEEAPKLPDASQQLLKESGQVLGSVTHTDGEGSPAGENEVAIQQHTNIDEGLTEQGSQSCLADQGNLPRKREEADEPSENEQERQARKRRDGGEMRQPRKR